MQLFLLLYCKGNKYLSDYQRNIPIVVGEIPIVLNRIGWHLFYMSVPYQKRYPSGRR